MEVPYKGPCFSVVPLTGPQISAQINDPYPPNALALVFKMESCAMRNRLEVRFWGLHLNAEGIVGIVVALLIVIAVLAASRL